MIFALTDKLADSILFSMEDQNCVWMIDAANGIVIPENYSMRTPDVNELVPQDACIDEENYYSLPEWSSNDGYELLEDFTNDLHSPFARTELRAVLVSGRGVFRNFKNVLKAYPEVERKWHFYKNEKMKARLMEWYNNLRESWGLEKFIEKEIDEIDDLVQNDFEFKQYDFKSDWNDIKQGEFLLTEEFKKQFPGEIGKAVSDLWFRLSSYTAPESKYGFVCRTQTDDFTGCILVSSCPENAKETVAVTDFFVSLNYRGLGIGRELLSECLQGLKENGIRWVLTANTIIPEAMEPLLISYGFEKTGSGFVADLFKEV